MTVCFVLLFWVFLTLFSAWWVAAIGGATLAALIGAARDAAWPTVPGVVVSAAVEEGTRRVDGVTVPTFTPQVVFAYAVDGTPHTGDAITAGMLRLPLARATTGAAARQFVERYPAGQSVAVHYDPADPRRAYLERTGEWGTAVPLLLLCALFWGVINAITALLLLPEFTRLSPRGGWAVVVAVLVGAILAEQWRRYLDRQRALLGYDRPPPPPRARAPGADP